MAIYTPNQMIEALDTISIYNIDEAERFEAIGLSNMTSDTADLLMQTAQAYGHAL